MSTESIEVDYDLPHPPEKVWRALTEPVLLAKWLMENDIRAEVGAEFTFQATPIPGQWDGRVQCKVLEVERPRLLRYSWVGGSDSIEGYGGRLDTVVTWTLEATAEGTRLHLSHSGFTEKNRYAFENMGLGWRTHMSKRILRVLAEL